VLVLVRFQLLRRMLMIVRSMIACVLMVVHVLAVRMFVFMLMRVPVDVAVHMSMRMTMYCPIVVRVLVRMGMRMFVRVALLVFAFPFHGFTSRAIYVSVRKRVAQKREELFELRVPRDSGVFLSHMRTLSVAEGWCCLSSRSRDSRRRVLLELQRLPPGRC